MTANRIASIRARLLNLARQSGRDFNLVLVRYALERWLYRLSISPDRDRFLLKGALLFDLWFDMPQRPTRDIDLLGFGPDDANDLRTRIAGICELSADDGMDFDANSISIEAIRKEANYGGLRAQMLATLGTARCIVQIDVGFGDAVTPGPIDASYPTLLPDVEAPLLRTYPPQTAIAEKCEAMISLGMRNSRMKDYFDLWILMQHARLGPTALAEAIAATCNRRSTALPTDWPDGLDDRFSTDAGKQRQWAAFLQKNALQAPALHVVVAALREWLAQPLQLARAIRA